MLATLAGVVVLLALTGIFSAQNAVLAGFVIAAVILAWMRVTPRPPAVSVSDEDGDDSGDPAATDPSVRTTPHPTRFSVLAFALRLIGGLALGWLLASALVATEQIPPEQQRIIGAALGVLLLTMDFIRHRTRVR